MSKTLNTEDIHKAEKHKVLKSLYFPLIFVVILWAVKIIEVLLDLKITHYGIYPLTLSGLRGIIFTPFLHGSYEHLFNNSVPLLILGTALFYFYRDVAFKIIVLSWLLSGFWVWFTSPGVYHIGASGLVYAWASFLFFSGVIRKNKNLLAISLLVVFAYGSLIWGIFPIKEGMSWEGHLMGGLAGLVLAFFYKEHGPAMKKMPDWMEEEEDDEDDDEDAYWKEG